MVSAASNAAAARPAQLLAAVPRLSRRRGMPDSAAG